MNSVNLRAHMNGSETGGRLFYCSIVPVISVYFTQTMLANVLHRLALGCVNVDRQACAYAVGNPLRVHARTLAIMGVPFALASPTMYSRFGLNCSAVSTEMTVRFV
jgi:hypothetical protein